MVKGTIFNIQKFCVNDGPGIRTTVFLKGCPLRCLWCHNPESNRAVPELFFDGEKCSRCGRCAAVCPKGVHSVTAEGHDLLRDRCMACGACAKACLNDALETVGYEITAEDALKEVSRDELFYKNSGGGMTVSGGEPFAQPEFTLALLSGAKSRGYHTCVETCGYAPTELLERAAAVTDLFLFDYKLTDPELHKRYTGVSNDRILANLHRLDALGAPTVLRCPIIPTVNDTPEHFAGIAATANSLAHVTGIDIEPYHPLGSGKSRRLGRAYALDALTFPSDDTVAGWIDVIRAQTDVSVRKA